MANPMLHQEIKPLKQIAIDHHYASPIARWHITTLFPPCHL